MESLQARERNQEAWSLQSDKDLLKALQDMSGDIMASMQRFEAGLSDLERDAVSLTAKTGTAIATFNGLCQMQFIEQEVAASETGRQTTGEASTPRTVITAENYSQVVHPKYREALQLAASAFDVSPSASGKQAPLPLIFGSPEYLQDSTFGTGSTPRLQEQQQEQAHQQAAAASIDAVPDAEQEEELSDQVPDFRAMLEAALRGELDSSLTEALGNGTGDATTTGLEGVEDVPETDAAPLLESSQLQRSMHDLLVSDLGTGGEDSVPGHRSVSDGVQDAVISSVAALPASKAMSEQTGEGEALEEGPESPREEVSLQDLLQGDGQLFSEEDLRSL